MTLSKNPYLVRIVVVCKNNQCLRLDGKYPEGCAPKEKRKTTQASTATYIFEGVRTGCPFLQIDQSKKNCQKKGLFTTEY